MTSVLQEWVTTLPLRHQSTLLSAVRGCDGIPKRDPSKVVVSALRGAFMESADPKELGRPGSFLYTPPTDTLLEALRIFESNHDEYPTHFVLHVVHAAQVVGFKHPDVARRVLWGRGFYQRMVTRFHMLPEGEREMDVRLTTDRNDKNLFVPGRS